MKSWLTTFLCFAFPVLTDFLPRRTKQITVHVRKHTRRGFAVRKHTRQITVPVVQQTCKVLEDNPYYTCTRTTDRLFLPPGAKITHAPRFETEYVVSGEGWNSRSLVRTNGDIVTTEMRYKKRGNK